jgi:uncharacterized protein YbjQ (UPF0145 family)
VREELPAGAEPRLAGVRASGTWGSALTSGEFAAIRSVGFEPVGQVFGAAVFGVAYGDGYSCPRTTALSTAAVEARSSGRLQERDGRGPERARQRLERVGQRPGRAGDGPERDDHGPLGPLVRAMDQARRTAVERMTAQCAELGGDGVVGLRVSRGPFLLGGQEFTALGTAVRARGTEFTALGASVQAPDGPDDEAGGAGSATAVGEAGKQPAPFTSDLSGQDFAKLIMAGWVPVGLVLGVAIGACHDDWQTTRQTRRWSGNREVAGWTDAVNQSRREAGRRLQADVQRLGGEGAVIASMQLRVSVRDCPAQIGRRDHIIEASVLGTAVARFARASQGPRTDQKPRTDPEPRAGYGPRAEQRQGPVGPALAVLPLASQNRQSRI